VRETVRACRSAGVKFLTLYAFSVANWKRPRLEVQALMRLLADFAKSERQELRDQGIRLNVVGDLEDLPLSARHSLESAMEYTADGEHMTLSLALSYGGRDDIITAARAIAVRARSGLLLPEQIDEALFRSEMTTHTLPDVDVLIRTGGEARVSDFLLFEGAYAELFFLPVMWPDFGPAELERVFADYRQRERRFGLTSAQVLAEDNPHRTFDPADSVSSPPLPEPGVERLTGRDG
jgi:undecaprenyl diphosphate synthase